MCVVSCGKRRTNKAADTMKTRNQSGGLIRMTETKQIVERDEIFELMERRDEKQIIQELQGEMLEEFVYSFPSGGKVVTGLSWAGVKEAVRRMGSIKVTHLEIEDDEDSWIAKAKARDTVNDVEMWGVAQQRKIMKYKDGTELKDMFALQKCVSKAQRNALRTLIPEKMIAKMIQWFLDNKKNKGRSPFGKKEEV